MRERQRAVGSCYCPPCSSGKSVSDFMAMGRHIRQKSTFYQSVFLLSFILAPQGRCRVFKVETCSTQEGAFRGWVWSVKRYKEKHETTFAPYRESGAPRSRMIISLLPTPAAVRVSHSPPAQRHRSLPE